MTETDRSDVFQLAVGWLFGVEGGYADDPDDRGGRTRFGISARSYPDIDIRALTPEEAAGIYRRDYWDAFQCGRLPPAMAAALFDAAVQHRPKTARRLLQRGLGVVADGLIGPVTRQAAAMEDPLAFLPIHLSHRAVLYRDLAAQPSQAKYYRGWMRRIFSLQQFILQKILGAS